MKTYGKTSALAALVVGVLLGSGHAASAGVILLDEDFNDVTRNAAGNPMQAGTNRTVAAITADWPNELPAGTTTTGTAAWTNVRRGDNTINTTGGNQGFGSFFATQTSNNFLVVGDNGSVIGSTPGSGTSAVFFPFDVGGASSITVSFDWAFNGVDTVTTPNVADLATVFIVGSFELPLLQLTSDTHLGQSGSFSQEILAAALPSGSLSLRFRLVEHTNAGTNTAFGIDNVRVVPEPTSLVLLGLGLVGLGMSRRITTR